MRDDPRESDGYPRRRDDTVRFWLPIIVSLITMILTLGTVYGRLGGRLDLIEYRLQQIEQRMKL